MPPKPPKPPEPPTERVDLTEAEESPTGGHLVLPNGLVVPVPPGWKPKDPEELEAKKPNALATMLKPLIVPVVTATVTAFLAAGGVISIGAQKEAGFVHLTEADVRGLNDAVTTLRTQNAAVLEALRQTTDENEALERRIRALELQNVEISTTLRIHMEMDK